MIYEFDGYKPVIDPFLYSQATIIGNIIGKNTSPGAH